MAKDAEKAVQKMSDDETVSFSGKRSIYDILEDEIASSDISDSEKVKKLSQLLRLRNRSVNILVTGATGVGKSSTINALFNMELAKVGVGVDPETSVIECYELEKLTIWDTPGVGDNVKTDKAIMRAIVEKLNETDDNSIIDGMESGADLGQDLLGIPGMIAGVIAGDTIGVVRGVFGPLRG